MTKNQKRISESDKDKVKNNLHEKIVNQSNTNTDNAKKRNTFAEDEELTVKFNTKMLKKSFKYAVPYKRLLITTVVFMLIVSFIVLIPATLNKYIVDNVINRLGVGALDWRGLLVLILSVWIGIIIIDIIFAAFRTFYMSKIGHSIVRDIRKDTFANLQKLSFDYYDARPMGKILVRVTSYLDDVSNIFSNAVITALVDFFKILMIIVWLFVIDWRLTFVVLIMVVPMSILLVFLRKAVVKVARAQRAKDGNMTAYIAENVKGVFVTKAFNRAKYNNKVYKGLYMDSTSNFMKWVRRNEAFYPISDGFFMLGTLAVYGVALAIVTGVLPLFGTLTIGTLLAFISYMGMFSAPINNIATVMQRLSIATSNLERVFEVTDSDLSIIDDKDAYELPNIVGRVKFDNVTFSYDNVVNVLENLSVEVEQGKMIALVGPTGAGKTTIVSLISRFYDVKSGVIYIDDNDISKVTQNSLRRQIGVMMQDSFIFSGTIIDNIRYARKEATDEECIQAAKKVYAHDFINKLPKGYYTETLEQGLGLSTGERQLLSFARVVLTDPKILILDEATSSIDTETESKIKKVLDEILIGRTSFVIAHRLSTIRKADNILYIADKGILEQGTHDQLMIQKGLYYQLVTTH